MNLETFIDEFDGMVLFIPIAVAWKVDYSIVGIGIEGEGPAIARKPLLANVLT